MKSTEEYINTLVGLVIEREEVGLNEAVRLLGVDRNRVEKWIDLLKKHKILDVKHSLVGADIILTAGERTDAFLSKGADIPQPHKRTIIKTSDRLDKHLKKLKKTKPSGEEEKTSSDTSLKESEESENSPKGPFYDEINMIEEKSLELPEAEEGQNLQEESEEIKTDQLTEPPRGEDTSSIIMSSEVLETLESEPQKETIPLERVPQGEDKKAASEATAKEVPEKPESEQPPEMADIAVEVKGITKKFEDADVLQNVNLVVKRGSIVGLVGPNGAGKTTLIRILCGDIKPTSGSAFVNGFDASTDMPKIGKLISVVRETPKLYEDMSISEFLTFYGVHRGLDKKEVIERIRRITAVLDIPDAKKNTKITYLSKGEKRKVEIARALITNPKILLLDDPFDGLGILTREVVVNLMKDMKKEGTSVLITTHYLREIEDVCDSLAILVDGRITEEMSIDTFKKRYRTKQMRVRFKIAEDKLKAIPFAATADTTKEGEYTIKIEISKVSDAISAISSCGGELISVQEIGEEDLDLDAIYARIISSMKK